MTRDEALKLLRGGPEGVKRWNETRPKRIDLSGANLVNADLRGAKLFEVDLHRAKLGMADLGMADLGEADLGEANLQLADLRGACLYKARLHGADLSGADLSGADLRLTDLLFASFRKTLLDRAKFEGAIFGQTVVSSDVSVSEGLEDVVHEAPSILSAEMLLRDVLPVSFLRGCGVPDVLIDKLDSLRAAQEPFQYNSCFISYSTKDEAFCKKLHARMQDAHLRVWFAPRDLKGGDKLKVQIDRAIQIHDRLLLVLTEHSMQSSWVETEIYEARQRELREKRRILFPIRLVPFERLKAWKCFDADTGMDLAREIRQYFIPDFSDWESESSFETAFEKLLDALRVAAELPATPTVDRES